MKRALAMGLGALMVAGSAAPASAAAHIDFSGYYRIMYMNEVNTSYGSESRSFTDSYFQDRLQLDLTFSPTDEISVHWRLRGPGSYARWGNENKNGLSTKHIYGEIKQDWGTILVGRMADDLDCAGLCTFGYAPSTIPVYTSSMAFDRGDVMDGIRYSYDWDNGFSILAQYVKLGNGGLTNGGQSGSYSDEDFDRIQVQGAYAWDGGGASLHVFYDRNAQSAYYGDWDGWRPGDVWTGRVSEDDSLGMNAAYHGFAPDSVGWLAQRSTYFLNAQRDYALVRDLRLHKTEQWGLNPSIMHTWGDFSVHFEGMATWGQANYTYTEHIVNNGGPLNSSTRERSFSMDGDGYGAYLDFDYNYGPGNVTLAGWWVSGTNVDEMYNRNGTFNRNAESGSLANLVGGNFYPLLVAYNGGNNNPGENRYYGNAGNHLSGIGFANNAYENYVWANHAGRFFIDNVSNDAVYNSTNSVNIAGAYIYDGINVVSSAFERDVLTANNNNRTRTVSFNNGTDANHWAIALTGNHAFTDDISMHYGLAYLGLNKANYRIVKGATYNATSEEYERLSYTTQDKDLGFEIDLGFTFQLLDNLSFTTAFGYMFNGDAYKQFKGYKLTDKSANQTDFTNGTGRNIKAVWEDADDSYVWFNSLTFAF